MPHGGGCLYHQKLVADVNRLLREVADEMTIVAAALWDDNRQAAISLNRKAVQCRMAAIALKPNEKGQR